MHPAASYVADVCGVIEAAARRNAARSELLRAADLEGEPVRRRRRQPGRRPGHRSVHARYGRLRGLTDPFNPAEALFASALYFAELARDFGNIGLAAVAYNGGEARASVPSLTKVALPLETRADVHAITGYSAVAWRDAPPAKVDLALPGTGFPGRLHARAARTLREFRSGPPVSRGASSSPRTATATAPSARSPAAAPLRRHPGAEPVSYDRGRRPGMPSRLYMAQIGRESRAEADALCAGLRRSGGDCMVLRN